MDAQPQGVALQWRHITLQTCVALLLALGMHFDLDSAAEGAYTNMGFQLLNVHIQRWCMHNQQLNPGQGSYPLPTSVTEVCTAMSAVCFCTATPPDMKPMLGLLDCTWIASIPGVTAQ